MVERNAGLRRGQAYQFRIGVNLGDVLIEGDGDMLGDGVNIAARLEGIAKPGAICLSRSAYDQVRGRVEIDVIDVGEQRLKNIAEPVHAYSFAAEAIGLAPARSGRATVANPRLPSVWGNVCGRAHAGAAWRRLARLAHMVAAARARGHGRRSPRQARNRAAPLHRRPAVRKSERRSRAGIFRRRHHRGSDDRPLASARQLRHRPQHGLHLQGQAGRREANRQRTRRALSAPRQRARDARRSRSTPS